MTSWKPTKTAKEFAKEYARGSGMTVAQLAVSGIQPRPCACGMDRCSGWQMAHTLTYDASVTAWKEGYGPHPAKLTKAEWARYVAEYRTVDPGPPSDLEEAVIR
jgi:hypothetical protein